MNEKKELIKTLELLGFDVELAIEEKLLELHNNGILPNGIIVEEDQRENDINNYVEIRVNRNANVQDVNAINNQHRLYYRWIVLQNNNGFGIDPYETFEYNVTNNNQLTRLDGSKNIYEILLKYEENIIRKNHLLLNRDIITLRRYYNKNNRLDRDYNIIKDSIDQLDFDDNDINNFENNELDNEIYIMDTLGKKVNKFSKYNIILYVIAFSCLVLSLVIGILTDNIVFMSIIGVLSLCLVIVSVIINSKFLIKIKDFLDRYNMRIYKKTIILSTIKNSIKSYIDKKSKAIENKDEQFVNVNMYDEVINRLTNRSYQFRDFNGVLNNNLNNREKNKEIFSMDEIYKKNINIIFLLTALACVITIVSLIICLI